MVSRDAVADGEPWCNEPKYVTRYCLLKANLPRLSWHDGLQRPVVPSSVYT